MPGDFRFRLQRGEIDVPLARRKMIVLPERIAQMKAERLSVEG